MDKKTVIQALEKIAVYLEVQGENPFKISAYRKAAQALEQDERALSEIDDPGELNGIGKGTAAVIRELITTGEASVLNELSEKIPAGLIPLLKLQGLGGKKVGKLYQELNITDAASLKQACEQGEVQALAGFGAKTEKKILQALEDVDKRPERLPIAFMLEAAEQVEEQLVKLDEIQRFERAGSLRRMKETVKDVDYILSVHLEDIQAVREKLRNLDHVSTVVVDGETKVSLELGLDYPVGVDFRLVADEYFATTLHHFTGSKDHNIKMRQLAKEQGEKVSEYGVENIETAELLTFEQESDFYAHFGLKWIPPEAREGMDETELFKESYPLIEDTDIQSDLHMHTTWSDGANSIGEMVQAAVEKGYSSIAITDHSHYLQVANGLSPERLKRQIEEVNRVNEQYEEIEVLAGTEMDIRPDGTLDFDDELLKKLDLVIASIHSGFSQSEEEIMYRLTQALDNPHVDIIAHPTGRLIGRREGINIDLPAFFKKAAETHTVLELNANPNRLDLSADLLKEAAETGVKFAINTDAHRINMLDHMTIGTGTARKALLTKDQIINTWTPAEIRDYFI
ncbi:DNA polymerase/3'-5' exonuclease PolX [Salsuginibacillus kocurii]|uniref:DNA polymerase/3'-5' exonuclease PolX n=1 Tax=Salsuginibacillus kocurii TaxID=427078 RepID=UPI000361A0AB|nr:DNA polymerase/3'-5' exonuclease PolX [Salsuginibacillus kocurii]